MLFWREIGAITLAQNWAYTELTNSNLFRITHQIDNQPPDTLRAVIGQETEDIVFDRRLMGYKLGAVEGQLIVMPEGISERRLAVQRLDRVVGTNWTIKIEELIDLAINLPLPISEVEGLESELAEKAIASEVEAALLGKAPTVHGHGISDVTGLGAELAEKAIASEVEAALLGKAPTVHGHGISDVSGLEAELAEKAIASEVEAALLGKAPTVHGHGISDVTGLEAELAEKAIASEVTTALAGKAPTVHGHEIVDINGLLALLETLEPINNVIESVNQPLSPFRGLIWNELASNGLLIESWVWRNAWVSLTNYKMDHFGPSGTFGASVSYQIPLDDRYNYYFKDFFVHCIYSSGTVDATNFFRSVISVQPTGIEIANSGAIPNDGLSKRFPVNQLFVPQVGERLTHNPQEVGTAPNARIAMSLSYNLVRK
jgi:hypothetical protein